MESAELLAQITGVSIQLARLVVCAENGDDEMTGRTEEELIRIRIQRVHFLVRVMRIFFENDELNLLLNS